MGNLSGGDKNRVDRKWCKWLFWGLKDLISKS